jgi:hypothetical protein
VSPPDEDALACEAVVVVGSVPILAIVGDFEPLEQAASVKAKPMARAGHS